MLLPILKSILPGFYRDRCRELYYHLRDVGQDYRSHSSIIGPSATLKLLRTRPRGMARSIPTHGGRPERLRMKGYRHPFYYREGTSDPDVIRQVFLRREYACVVGRPSIRTMIDCGANIGATSFYLLHHYPKARLIAVEPDRRNFAVCCHNLRPYGDRAICINAAVWSEPVPLRIVRGAFRDGREWSYQVSACRLGQFPDCEGMTISQLMGLGGFEQLDLVKIDIEGAEQELFRAPDNYASWLGRTRHVVIEMHGTEGRAVCRKALDKDEWEFGYSGELTHCTRKSRVAAAALDLPELSTLIGQLT